MVVVSEPNFSSSLSSNSFMVLCEIFFGDEWVGVGGVAHGLNFVRDGFSYGSLG